MHIRGARLSDPICYRKSFGDVWATTWAADGDLYVVSDDTRGFDDACGPQGSNLAISRISGQAPNLHGETINTMREYGHHGQFLDDDGMWKANGLTCIDGVLYLSISRHSHPRRPPFFIQQTWDASIIKSEDMGKTWSAMPRLGGAMFPGPTFSTPFFVQYGQDGAGTADGSDQFVYALSSDGVWNNGNSMVLGRVPRDRIQRLDPSDWSFAHGYDDDGEPVWRPRHDTARYVFRSPGRTGMTGLHYIEPLGLYILPQWHYVGLGETSGRLFGVTRLAFYQSPRPWGPWTLFHEQDFDPESWYNPCFPAKFISNDGRRLWMFVAGNFNDPEKKHYRLHQIEVILDVVADAEPGSTRRDERQAAPIRATA